MNSLANNKFMAQGAMPSTPNLEQYKNKPRNKKLNPSSTPIQPTQQPNIFQSFCSLHPSKKADFSLHRNPNKKFCCLCASIYGGENNFLDPDQDHKRM